MNYNNYVVGNIIRMRREALELSKNRLADLVGVSHTEIRRIEDGVRKSYNLNVLKRICDVLDLNVRELLFEMPKTFEKTNQKYEKNFNVKVIQTFKNSYEIEAKNEREAAQKILDFLVENNLILVDPIDSFDIEVYSEDGENLQNFNAKNKLYRVRI